MNTRITGVYMVLHIASHAAYIGSSFCCGSRINAHKWFLRHNCDSSAQLQKLWNLTEESEWLFAVVEILDHRSLRKSLQKREQYWIDSWIGEILNGKRCADGSGFEVSSESRRKMSVSATGRKHSAETKRKISASLRSSMKWKEWNRTRSTSQRRHIDG